MNSHGVSSSFPENLIRNQNLLSEGERELLASILRHARRSGGESSMIADDIEAVLSRAVGEVLLARAAERAGSDALDEIRRQSMRTVHSGPTPAPGPRPPAPAPGPGPKVSAHIVAGPTPAPGPRPPAPAPGPGPRLSTEVMASPPPAPGPGPRPPAPAPGPGPRLTTARVEASSVNVALYERPDVLPADCVVFEEFLAPQELQELTRYALDRESEFRVSQVISPGVEGGVINPEYRRSRVLMELGRHGELVFQRIQSVLPRVLGKLGMEAFPITRVETQITASNDGDFFRHHSDNAEEEIARRQWTFVYFFHREPKAFQGGELRLHDARRENGVWTPTGEHRTVVPEQNQIVFFRSELLHEITPVICPSQAFADSRFTVNGWLHR